MKFTETEKWCVSADGEMFHDADYDSKEDAIKACIEECAGSYVGRMVKVEFDETDFCEDVEENYADILYDEVGDAAESWELPAEHEIELNKEIGKLIADYLTKHDLQPTCYKVVDIEGVEM